MNWDLAYGYNPPCHSERSRTKCGEVEESVLFTPFLGDGSFDSLRSLRMTVVVVTWLRRFEQSDKLKFENRHMIFWEWGILVLKRM